MRRNLRRQRVSLCQGGPGARCAGVAVPASVDDVTSDTESVDSDPDRAEFLKGQSPVVMKKWKSPVRPSATSQRAGFVLFDHWDLGETFVQRGCLMRSVPRFLWRVLQGGGEGGSRGNYGRCFQKE